jgi:uncharacterized coiled-coil protein SlyX
MPKKIVPTPAPTRITVGEKILARMDEVLSHVSGQEDLLASLESQITILSQSILEVIEQLDEIGPRMERLEVVALSARDNASAAEFAAMDAKKGMEDLTASMPDVQEVVDHIRSQELIALRQSLKPAF